MSPRGPKVAGDKGPDAASREWWRKAVIYENHLPSFRDGNGDGIGDLDGLIASLGYLGNGLGVTAIWTGPFFRSPLRDQGFDITDHTDVDPVFGNLETVDRLLDAAHSRGIKIIIDYVPNHTSDRHPWFVQSRSSRDNPKRDWYVWTDAASGRSAPNNWVSEAGGSSWEWDEHTGQFYLHSHLVEQPDLNWRNPEAREAMLDVLRFWLDRGVDGFRVDVAHMLMKDPQLRDNPPSPDATPNIYDIQHPDFSSQLHVNDRMHPDLHGCLREMRKVLDGYDGDRVIVGEVEAMDWARWAAFFGEDLDQLHLPFAFKLVETPWRAPELASALGGLYAALPEGAWPCLALGNHDRPRLATRLGRLQARVAAMLLLTLRGTPTIFYGDELGMVDQAVPPERQRDFFGLTAGGASRDPTRTPMPWNQGPNAGFSTGRAPELWLPTCREYQTINVEAQLGDDHSSLNLYRQLISLRQSSKALRAGSYLRHPASNNQCLVYARSTGDERKIVALNLTPQPCTLSVGEPGVIALSTSIEGSGKPVSGTVALAGNEGVIIALETP